jgi:hypothetical protein
VPRPRHSSPGKQRALLCREREPIGSFRAVVYALLNCACFVCRRHALQTDDSMAVELSDEAMSSRHTGQDPTVIPPIQLEMLSARHLDEVGAANGCAGVIAGGEDSGLPLHASAVRGQLAAGVLGGSWSGVVGWELSGGTTAQCCMPKMLNPRARTVACPNNSTADEAT